MKKFTIIISGFLLFFIQCAGPERHEADETAAGERLPRVLIITTGLSEENAKLAQGIVIAIQSFAQMGATVRLEPRDILYDFGKLSSYDILILSTFPGYHDADRKYSLSYMSDEELHNLTLFVENGGVLISGDNTGRNYNDGTDRIIVFQHLKPENWELANCFGATFTEKNLTGYSQEGNIAGYLQWDLSKDLFSGGEREFWTLVPETFISKNQKIFGYWKKEQDSIAGFLENDYGKGKAYLLPSSGLLHPGNDGGFWSADQISSFYTYVTDEYYNKKGIRARLKPWPSGFDYAFSVSLNAIGAKENYERVFRLLEKEKILPTIFVNGSVDESLKEMLRQSGNPLASSGYGYINHTDLQYPQAVEDILLNENFWGTDFKGFRFPFTNPANWSILALGEHDYSYESSIGADNTDFFHGSIIPYNLVVTNDGFYRSTDILEIAPSYHDDYYFLGSLGDQNRPDTIFLEKNIAVYSKYLVNFWKYAVKPYDGLMVYLGHPAYVGFSDSTTTSLSGLISQVKKDNTWITTLEEVAEFRKGLGMMEIYTESEGSSQKIYVKAPQDLIIKEVCIDFKSGISNASAKMGKIRIIEKEEGSQLVFDASDGQTVTFRLD